MDKSPAEIAYQWGKAHSLLRKVEKIFSNMDMEDDPIEMKLLDLIEFCNLQVQQLSGTKVFKRSEAAIKPKKEDIYDLDLQLN